MNWRKLDSSTLLSLKDSYDDQIRVNVFSLVCALFGIGFSIWRGPSWVFGIFIAWLLVSLFCLWVPWARRRNVNKELERRRERKHHDSR